MIAIKDWHELAAMRSAGAKLAEVVARVRPQLAVGMTTDDLDRLSEEAILALGAKPAFKGYRVGKAVFPKSLCVSINEQVVHGIPGRRRIREGDIVSVDFGLVDVSGYYADTAYTVAMPGADDAGAALVSVTEAALGEAIERARPGLRIGDIGHAVQTYVESRGYSVVTQFVGHGIGRRLHEEPSVPNFGKAGTGYLLKAGMVLAIEPMVTLGGGRTKVLKDEWTVVTEDGSRSAHFEHTVAITPSGPQVLTVLDSASPIR